jgi:prolyl-tRNA editing enzyme YbaK/EbsC (Cys-tRNA(Pro) deacylase)
VCQRALSVVDARGLGLEPDDIAKTLIVKTLEGYLRAVVPASGRLDER